MFGSLQVTPYTPVLEDCVPEEMKEDFQKFICGVSNSIAEYEENLSLYNDCDVVMTIIIKR